MGTTTDDVAVGRSVGRSVTRSVGRSHGRSVGHSLDRSVGHSVGRPRVDDDEGFRSNARARVSCSLVASSRRAMIRKAAREALANASKCVHPSSLAPRECARTSARVLNVTRAMTTDVAVDAYKVGESTNIKWHEGAVDRATRERALGQRGCVLWFTGLSGSGKSTVAYTLEHELFKRGKVAQVLDGDNIRHGLNSNLGFSFADREENIRRIGEVSKLYCDSGMITLVSFISPYRKDRQKVRERVGGRRFVEVYMKIPLSVCEERDPKGLYKAARAGKIKGFTGIDDPYEEPKHAEIEMVVAEEDGVMASPVEMAHKIIDYLEKKGFLEAPKSTP